MIISKYSFKNTIIVAKLAQAFLSIVYSWGHCPLGERWSRIGAKYNLLAVTLATEAKVVVDGKLRTCVWKRVEKSEYLSWNQVKKKGLTL